MYESPVWKLPREEASIFTGSIFSMRHTSSPGAAPAPEKLAMVDELLFLQTVVGQKGAQRRRGREKRKGTRPEPGLHVTANTA
jgi:hypothetical protein